MLLEPGAGYDLTEAQCDKALRRLDWNFSAVMATEQIGAMFPLLHYLFGRRSPQGWLLPLKGAEKVQQRTTELDSLKRQLLQDDSLQQLVYLA
jgi:hypothetical protein